jgi:hypothetical protein
MEAIEKAYAIAQLVRTIASIAPKIAAGAATMFSQLGVFAFPAVAAMIAVMAGPRLRGQRRRWSRRRAAEICRRRAPARSSATIRRKVTASPQPRHDGEELDQGPRLFERDGRSLRKIESGIGNLAAAIAKELQVGGAFDTRASASARRRAKASASSARRWAVCWAASSAARRRSRPRSTTRASSSTRPRLPAITERHQRLALHDHPEGHEDQRLPRHRRRHQDQLFDDDRAARPGPCSGRSDSSSVRPLQQRGRRSQGARPRRRRMRSTFQVEIGKISFKDLTGQQITDELNAVFSKIGDQMAGFAVAGLEQFQKAGEGLFETLMRLAKDYLTVDAALKSIGLTFGSVGVASIAARESLIDLDGRPRPVRQPDQLLLRPLPDQRAEGRVRAAAGRRRLRSDGRCCADDHRRLHPAGAGPRPFDRRRAGDVRAADADRAGVLRHRHGRAAARPEAGRAAGAAAPGAGQ